MNSQGIAKSSAAQTRLFLCGDVVTGRGIDQVLPHPGDPAIHEPYLKSARGYVELAERVNGAIPQSAGFSYIWGDALEEMERVGPDLRIINLETSITKSDDYWKDKEIHYRMNPDNIRCLTAARIDCCSLANNHILDWGYSGLKETLETLKGVGIKIAGAGQNLRDAEAPAVMEVRGKGRVIFFSFGSATSGIPFYWAASKEKPGVNLLEDFSEKTVRYIKRKIQEIRRGEDVVVASIHWGGNWGYRVPPEQIEFAHKMIELAGVDVIHGHSSHHVKAIEVYKEKLILYGCGDFLNDYEGISGYESYRGDLALMYFATVNPSTGKLAQLRMTPMQIRLFRLNRTSKTDAQWLRDVLNREGKRFGNQIRLNGQDNLVLEWGKTLEPEKGGREGPSRPGDAKKL